jgi:PIN domain nuclease of toxin-antitoxin system
MSLLLDTSAFVRWTLGERMPKRLVTQLEKADTLFVSIATPWELAIKHARYPSKKLLPSEQLWKAIEQMGARILPINREHIELVATLPEHHRDPFDRMIIAQAISENLTLVSSDERFPAYKTAGLRVLWQ